MRTDSTKPDYEIPRDDIEFLVSSWNRLDVLEAVATAPRTRDELREMIGVARVTLSRILSDLEAKGWIVRDNQSYEATTAGEFVATEVTNLLENLRALNDLEEHVNWMPIQQFDFDLCRLHDAKVITPTWDDFSAYTSTLVDLVYESTVIKGIGTGVDREFIQAMLDAIRSGELSVEMIYQPNVLEAITDDIELTRLFRDLADIEGATIYRYQGNEPLMMLGLHESVGERDDIVMLCGEHEEGAPPGTVQSTDPKVWSWADAYFEARRTQSHQLGAAVFTP